MTITINHQPHPLPAAQPLLALLAELQLASADGVALAINQQVVPRACWATTTIHPGDQLLLVGVIAGG